MEAGLLVLRVVIMLMDYIYKELFKAAKALHIEAII